MPSSISLGNYLRALTSSQVRTAPVKPRPVLVDEIEQFSEREESTATASDPFVLGSVLDGFVISGSASVRTRNSFSPGQSSRWQRSDGLQVRTFSFESFRKARGYLRSLGSLATSGLRNLDNLGFQEAFCTSDEDTVVFRRGNVVCRMSRYRSQPRVSVIDLARALDAALVSPVGGQVLQDDLADLPLPDKNHRFMYRLIAPTGKFVMQNGRPSFEGAAQNLRIFRHAV